MPIFHRKANPSTQTVKIAVAQTRSRELWGRGVFGGMPSALAYHGSLGSGVEGTEFTSDVPCAMNGDPVWAYWYLPEQGGDPRVIERVSGQRSFACVPIDPVLNRYRCRKARKVLK